MFWHSHDSTSLSVCAFCVFPCPLSLPIILTVLSRVQIPEREKLIGPVWNGPDCMIHYHHPVQQNFLNSLTRPALGGSLLGWWSRMMKHLWIRNHSGPREGLWTWQALSSLASPVHFTIYLPGPKYLSSWTSNSQESKGSERTYGNSGDLCS